MAKEFNWDVSINGEDHRVCCVLSNNKYILYVDDEYLTNVYRKSVWEMQLGLEAEVEICGKKCLFIVWDEKPDLVIDGVMQGKNTDYLQAREKRKQGCCKWFRILFWAGIAVMCLIPVLCVAFSIPVIKMDKWVKIWNSGAVMAIAGAYFKRKWVQW